MAGHACNAIDENVRCYLPGIGDSAVDLGIRFWIRNPMNGRANVTSDLLLGIWDRLAPVVEVQQISKSPAAPMPPATHMVTTAYFSPRRLASIKACPVRRAPVMP